MNIDIECRICGCVFRANFMELPHGRAVKCPYCHATALDVKSASTIWASHEADVPERAMRERAAERDKMKL